MTIKPEDEALVCIRTSCTKEEAVAKLLGWLRGPLIKPRILVTEDGMSADDLPFMHSLEVSLEAQLTELRAAAQRALVRAARSRAKDAPAALEEKETAAASVDTLIRRAQRHSVDIEDELSKGDASALRIDTVATEDTGVVHVTLVSLDQWARKMYGLSIFDEEFNRLEAAPSQGENPAEDVADPQGKGWSRTKAKNFALTFLLALEDIAGKTTPNEYRKSDGSLNANTLATRLAKVAAPDKDSPEADGQGAEAIRKRIAEALALKRA